MREKRPAKAPFFDRLWYGDLLVLPFCTRSVLLRQINRGKVVGPEHRPLALKFARKRLRVYGRVAVAAFALCLLVIVDALLDPSIGTSVSAAGWGFVYLGQALQVWRLRRFVRANERAALP